MQQPSQASQDMRNSLAALLEGRQESRTLGDDMREAVQCFESPGIVGSLPSRVRTCRGRRVSTSAFCPLRFEDYLFASGRSEVVLLAAEETVPEVLLVFPSTSIPVGYEPDPAVPLLYWNETYSGRCDVVDAVA